MSITTLRHGDLSEQSSDPTVVLDIWRDVVMMSWSQAADWHPWMLAMKLAFA